MHVAIAPFMSLRSNSVFRESSCLNQRKIIEKATGARRGTQADIVRDPGQKTVINTTDCWQSLVVL